MKTTLSLVGILLLGAFLGLEAYTKLTGEKTVPVALNIQENHLEGRPAEKTPILTTDQLESVSVSRGLAVKEANRKQLLQPHNPLQAEVEKMVESPILPVPSQPIPTAGTMENLAQPLNTEVVTPIVSLEVSDPLPTAEASTATVPKKKRRFLGIFPTRDRG
jgi:hypothetical protein